MGRLFSEQGFFARSLPLLRSVATVPTLCALLPPSFIGSWQKASRLSAGAHFRVEGMPRFRSTGQEGHDAC